MPLGVVKRGGNTMPFVSTDSARFDTTTNAYQFTVPENSTGGAVIGRIAFDGGGPGTGYFNLTGADAAKVRLADDGTLRLASDVALNFETEGGPTVLAVDFSVLFIGADGAIDQAATSGSRVTATDVDEPPTLQVDLTAGRFDEYSVDTDTVTKNSVFARITGRDEDGDSIKYSLSGTHQALFRIDGNAIKLKDPASFDFETLGDSIDLTVTATSTGSSGAPQTASQTVTININDVNEPISWNQSPPTFEIAENSAGDTAVGKVTANDGDGDPVTYSLSGDHADKFVIDAATGAITVKDGDLDYEAFAKSDGVFAIYVDAVANGPGGRSSDSQQKITIRLTDVNEPTSWDQSPPTFTIAENSAATTAVGTVTARDGDGDPVTYSLSGDHASKFVIDAATGAIAVNKGAVLDYEASGGTPLGFKVVATANGPDGRISRSEQEVTVRLTDVNEPISWDQSPPTFTLAENSAANTPVGTVTARDGDGDPVTYSLSGDHAGKFAINKTTGAITVNRDAALDYEAFADSDGVLAVYVDAVATGPDGRVSNGQQKITIRLTDVDEDPVLTVTPVGLPVAEHAPADTVVARFTARDPDGDPTNVYLGGAHRGLFTIVGDEVRVLDPKGLDFETLGDSIDLTVMAASRQDGNAVRLVREPLSIGVTDVDEGPVFDKPAYSLSVNENVPVGHIIGTVRAVDPDHDGAVTYEIAGPHAEKFEIDGNHRLILKEGQHLNYEEHRDTGGVITLDVTATSRRGGTEKTDSATITVTVADLDEAPDFVDPGGAVITAAAASVDENLAGATLATLRAVDPDGDPIVGYHVTSHTGLFRMAGNELRLRPEVALDHENLPDDATDGVIPVRVTAVSRKPGQPPKITHMIVNLDVGDVNDIDIDGITIDSTPGHPNVVQATAPAGTAIGRVAASSPAGDDITYGLTNADGSESRFFAMDDDGDITLKAAITDPVFLLRGYVPLTVTASAGGETESQNITVQVNRVIQVHSPPLPSLAGRTKTVPLNLPEREADGDTLHVVPTDGVVTTPHGRYQVTSDGTLTYTARAGFEGRDSLILTTGDSRGGEGKARIEFDVDLPSVTVVEGQSQTVTWDLLNLGGLATPSGNVRFTTLPTRGALRLERGDGTTVDVTTSMTIAAADIAAGRLTYRAEANFDGAHWQTAAFTLTDGGTARSGGFAIAVRDFDIADLHHIDDSQNARYLLQKAHDPAFITIGERTFLLVSSDGDHGVSVFEWNPATKRLTLTDTMADSEHSTLALTKASSIYHLELGDIHHIYVTSYYREDAITRLTLDGDGRLHFDGAAASVVRDSQNSQYALDGVWSLTQVSFGDSHYVIASGNFDKGMSVFRVGDDGNLEFLRSHRGSVTADDGASLALSGSVHGHIATIGDKTFFIGAMQNGDALVSYEIEADGGMRFIHAIRDTPAPALDNALPGAVMDIGGRTFIAVPSNVDDGFGMYELSSTGRLTHLETVFDRDNPAYGLDGAIAIRHFVQDGQDYIAITGSNEDAVSVFAVTPWGRPEFITTIRDAGSRQLDYPYMIDFHPLADNNNLMAVTGRLDHGFSVFEIDIDDPDAPNPLLTPAPDIV